MNELALSLAHTLTLDPFPSPDYSIIRTPAELTAYLYSGRDGYRDSLNPRPIIAEDTESLPAPSREPYCLTFSICPGTGRLIYVRDHDLIARYRDWLTVWHPHQLFHNYLHDSVIFKQLSLPVDHFTDTMVRAYNLCLGGGGDAEDDESRAGRGLLSLKVLAWRHLHMRMTSFQDTVHPHSIPYALAWLESACSLLTPAPPRKTCTCGHYRDTHAPRGKTGKVMGACTQCGCPRYKQGKVAAKPAEDKQAQLLYTKLNRLTDSLRAQETDPETGQLIDPWKRYKGWHDWDREMLEGALGPIPQPSIAYVPEEELCNYAIRDADATLRLYLYMRRLKPWIFYQR